MTEPSRTGTGEVRDAAAGAPIAVPERIPQDLYGRDRDDRLMRFLDRFGDFYTSASTRRDRYGRRPQRPRDRRGVPFTLVVAERRFASADQDVVALRLAAPGGGMLPAWQPGAHLDIELPSGLRRHYSLCGDPADRTGYRIAVRRLPDGGGGSVEVHEKLRPGVELTVRGPRNAFPFAADRTVLLLAGGIGITPLLPMARQAARAGLDWRLVHCGRTRASLPFTDELAALGADRVEVLADDEHGRPDGAGLLRRAPAGAAVYCCGPAPMLDAVRAAFDASRARALHFERFTPAPVVVGHPFEVRLRSTGTILQVPADRSVLDVLLDADPATPYSCRQGFCGVCTLTVASGTVEHRDSRLSARERAGGRMRVCVSRAPRGERLELER